MQIKYGFTDSNIVFCIIYFIEKKTKVPVLLMFTDAMHRSEVLFLYPQAFIKCPGLLCCRQVHG